MSSGLQSTNVNVDQLVQNLDEASKKELVQFLSNEEQRTRMQQAVHQYTDICWDKCISKVRPSMDKSDEECLKNCTERFIDTSLHIVNRFQAQQRRF